MIVLEKLNYNSKDIVLLEKNNGCIECISHSKDSCGYTRIRYNGKHERLYRVIYEKQYGKIPKGMVIRHKCDNPSCCNIEHLEIGTQKDNALDMVKRGRSLKNKPNLKSRGTKNGINKLSEQNVKDIYLSKKGYRLLSKEFNVSHTTIRLIKKKLIWKWFTDNL